MDDDAGTEPLEPPMLFDAQPGPRAQLAAIVEVLSVLASSASSQEEVFDTVLNNARRLCGADVAQIHLLIDGGAPARSGGRGQRGLRDVLEESIRRRWTASRSSDG